MTDSLDNRRWYAGITRYQWMILIIASLGWIFDVFEGQIFVATMNEAMNSLLPESVQQLPIEQRSGYRNYYIQITFAAFLLGGALGGIVFGTLADRIGRKRALSYTILMYSAFTCVSALSYAWWHLAGFRFLVAMGVGGEWAVASALVAEVFPKRARAWSLGIFHASSVLGSYLAIAAGQFIVNNAALKNYLSTAAEDVPLINQLDPATIPWRLSFLLGAVPALLILWIRRSVREPERWQAAKATSQQQRLGSLRDLLAPANARNTLVGVSLAAIGMATFWGVFVFGKEIAREKIERQYFGSIAQLPKSDVGLAVIAAYDEQFSRFKESEGPLSSALEQARMEMRADIEKHGLAQARSKLWLPVASLTQRQAKAAGSSVTGESGQTEPVRYLYFTELSAEDRAKLANVLQEAEKPFRHKIKTWEMLAMFLTTTGGGVGLICFGPLSDWLGRRPTFVIYHLGGFAIAWVVVYLTHGVTGLYCLLPVFGFLTMGMHAGYAIYFPELFPTRLRSTGGGVCFNLGRVLAAPILFLAGWMNKDWGNTLANTVSLLAFLYLLGIPVIAAARETKGEDLPE